MLFGKLLKRRIGYGNRPECHSEEQSDVEITSIETKNYLTIATNRISPRAYYRAEKLCYQFEQGQKILPQVRKIVCLVFSVQSTQADKRTLIKVFLYTECAYSGCEPQRQGK